MTSTDRFPSAPCGRHRHRPGWCLAAALLVLAALVPVLAQGTGNDEVDDEAVWRAFVTWLESLPEEEKATLQGYGERLSRDGLAADEVEQRLAVIRRLFTEQPERGIELTYNRIYSKPLTGDPEQDGFTSTPSEFMVESVKDHQPGTALDVGAGQGRNAVWLAEQGWQVTAIDISGAGLAAARANAEKAGRQISTVKTTYQEFDFGEARWDLVLMILSWAPVSDPAFVASLQRSLRPGGVIVFEHVIDKPDDPFPPVVHALQPDELRSFFSDLDIEYYDESERLGDWGGPPTPIVRMIARKKPAPGAAAPAAAMSAPD